MLSAALWAALNSEYASLCITLKSLNRRVSFIFVIRCVQIPSRTSDRIILLKRSIQRQYELLKKGSFDGNKTMA
jgi:hypothetical protein